MYVCVMWGFECVLVYACLCVCVSDVLEFLIV